MKLFKLLEDKKKFSLIVSLPENSVEMARAALDSGADAVKLHLNVHHPASGTRFGTFAEEAVRLEAVAQLARARKASLGIVPGAESVATLQELDELRSMGFEFLDCYARHLPAHYLGHTRLKRMVAVDPEYQLEELRGLASLGVDCIEASIIPTKYYGFPLMTSDLLRYRALASYARLPLVVPSQRHLLPADVPLLAWAGVAGIIIGAIVTGKDATGVGRVTAAFREAIEESI